ncbi:MAG: RuBisCO large subunit C-terminal-like domain-containing protein [Erysipelotrichaceae bacterium]
MENIIKVNELPFSARNELTDNYVLATYRVFDVTDQKILSSCAKFAVGQSIGTWVKVNGITEEMIEKYQARVIDIDYNEEGIFTLRVAFPSLNFGNSFASLLTSLLGNDVSTSLQIRLINLEFINQAAKDLGVKQKNVTSIEKLRKITGIYNRPIILNMIKPCLGYNVEVGAQFFKEVALGCVDLIKDDELMCNPSYNRVEERMKRYKEVALEVAEITGKETIYVPNITDRYSEMKKHAKYALEVGIKAVMVNFTFTGFDSFADICEEFGQDLFILGHYAGVSIYDSYKTGISNAVYLGVLPRACQADAVMTMTSKDYSSLKGLDVYKTIQAQTNASMIHPLVPTLGGGVTILDLEEMISRFGKDIIIGIGGGIQGHPNGATSGAKAIMSAIQHLSKGSSLEELVKKDDDARISFEYFSNL